VTALTPFQHKQLTARRDAKFPEWELLSEKVKSLRMDLVKETGASVKFQLKQQILEEEGNLSKLAAELEEIEQKLSQTPTFSPSTNNSDPSIEIQQNVEGNSNQVIGQVTGGNVLNIAGNVNILSPKSIGQTTLQIKWFDRSRQLLNKQKEQLTSSPIQGLKTRQLDDVHVPLGLMEWKNKERSQFGNSQEISPEKGSESYQQGYTETKRVEHDKFLVEMYKREPGKHIVILGEPGAGKTTILTRIWQYLLDGAHPEEQIIVAWVPLAEVKNDGLEDYLKKYWIKQFCKSDQISSSWKSFEELADAGQVWILLDGADEMGGDALGKIKNALNERWAESIRAIVTCRLNLWDASPTNSLASSQDFQIYRTLDFKYDSPAGDEVKNFIGKWFEKQPAMGEKLRSALGEEGKERIKDLVQNPLRLTLLCDIWEDNNELPDTQANLYRRFVDYVYKFKADKFPQAYNLRGTLDRAMGVLAKKGISKANLRFRFNQEELEESLPDIKHREALKDLGWLNCLGEDEDRQEVYAFFHPTFQEYFAACSIEDWDYFLPRAHIDRPVSCQDEVVPTYRVFEKQWQQVIVFWIGRNLDKKLKEEFLVELTSFRDETSEFYYYQAYCIAAICVGEFQSSRRAESIVQTAVKWAFGFFDPVQQAWVNLELVNSTLVSNILPLTQRQHLITSLLPLLFQNDLPYDATLLMDSIHTRLHAISVLGKTAKGNIKVIE
jgi:NACHT domain